MTLTGKFATAKTESFPTMQAATEAVAAYVVPHGFSNVRAVEDADGFRFTAKTPAGRGGRNVAFADYDYE